MQLPLTGFNNSIELKNVSFAYKDKDVFIEYQLNCAKGENRSTGGPSAGGGQINTDGFDTALFAWSRYQSGEILIDGENIQMVKVDSLRAQMGVVNQESILFNDTIFNNIAFGKTSATKEDVEALPRALPMPIILS